MIKAKNGKWVTEDNRDFDDYNEAVLHKRQIIRDEAIAAGYTTEAQIKTFRKRYWTIRDAKEAKKQKV